ncbi:hypothetical protein ABL78_2670 [Leptomonas seymouri]|uniref:Uncharacterized protein n=1 Tax=Leptomonas seymouri TaxID=5684 RepID=A0A0N0P706_LEPSE|nr:hypothetical protein ABL78_2670 [Leptomonas seymouri]|eukprot:KPI88246.1 hypothetical protein ABL78_2670 [Leptomonas seymouri]
MMSAVPASRPHVAEMERVTSESVALQGEAQNLRGRRLALEEAMRQERNRRLQHAAQKKTASSHKDANNGSQKQSQTASSAPNSVTEPTPSPSIPTADNQPPQDLEEYRRELDSDNGNKEVYRLHYYTNSQLNPADVHFFKAKGRLREYQRHVPSPSKHRTSPHRVPRREDDTTQVLTIAPARTDDASEQWTKAALLRMEANKRVLKRIQEREKREASLAATRGAARAVSAHRREPEAAVTKHHTVTSPPARAAASLVEHASSARAPPPPLHHSPSSYVPPAPYHFEWRSSRVQGATGVAPAVATTRWSPPRSQHPRSPPRSHFGSSPFSRYNDESSQRFRVAQSSPLRPSLTYSSASWNTSNMVHNDMNSPVEGPSTTASPWRLLSDLWTPPSRGPVRSVYQPIAQQGVTTASSAPWESRRAWEDLTKRGAPSSFNEERKPFLFSYTAASSATTTTKNEAEVEVSPLTPSVAASTAPRRAGVIADDAEQAAVITSKHSLLEGFRMPDTILKRDDLFQGTS